MAKVGNEPYVKRRGWLFQRQSPRRSINRCALWGENSAVIRE
jgi:hypothetical protein